MIKLEYFIAISLLSGLYVLVDSLLGIMKHRVEKRREDYIDKRLDLISNRVTILSMEVFPEKKEELEKHMIDID